MKLHTGDSVIVISGKDKGKQGTVMRILRDTNRVVVEGINMRTRHIKKTQNQAGQRIIYEASLHASNVMILDPKTKKPTRIGYKVDEKTGKKTRIARKSGEVITKSATTKAAKSSAKTEKDDEKTTKKASTKKTDTPAAPAKSPFWKRGAAGNESGLTDAGQTGASDVKSAPSAHRAQGG